MNNESYASLESLYKHYQWKTPERFIPLAKRHGFDDEDEIREFLNKKVSHDIKRKDREMKGDMLPIYSKVKDAYQFDTLIQSNGNKPFLVFINVNTRKAYVYAMKNKGSIEVRNALFKFKNDVGIVNSLTSDQDSAYTSYEVLRFMKDNGINYRTTDDENHNILGIINRFIRTLRDLNEDRDFTNDRMRELVNEYNNSPHKSLDGKSPNEFTDQDEDEYITSKEIESVEMKKNIELNEGDYVRIILDKKPLDKNRSNLSNEAYVIEAKDGNHFVIRATDGSVDRYPVYRLMKCSTNIKLADTIKDDKRGIVDKILSYDEKHDKYRVLFDEGTKDYIPAKNLRESDPTKLSEMERKFWLGKHKIPVKIREFW